MMSSSSTIRKLSKKFKRTGSVKTKENVKDGIFLQKKNYNFLSPGVHTRCFKYEQHCFFRKYCNVNWPVLHVILQSTPHWLLYIFSSIFGNCFIPFSQKLFGWVRTHPWTYEITAFLSSNRTPSKSFLSLPNKKKSLGGYICTLRWVGKEVPL